MTLSECASPAASAALGRPFAHLLAAALAHLLSRDEARPARWRAASFGELVEAARADLRLGAAAGSPPRPELDDDHVLGFHEAVARLARNPGDVAVAIRRLELSRQRALAPWPNLVRRGLPVQPSDLDRASWLG